MHSPRFSELLQLVGVFESAEQRYEDDMVVMLFGLIIQYRSPLFGEGEGG